MCKQKTTSEFIENARKIHGDKYDYSKVEYKNNHTKICIICPKHGEFWQQPNNHLKGANCPKCAKEHHSQDKRLTTEEFIKKSKSKHGDKYDYSKTHYINAWTKVTMICPKHGDFSVYPARHLTKPYKHHGLNGGCPLCFKEKNKEGNGRRLTQEQFLDKAQKIHGDKYDYSKAIYYNSRSKVTIICPKHGEFYPIANQFLKGTECPLCNESKMEKSIASYLDSNNITYEREKTFEWLKNKILLQLDFYLPEWNLAIECQGKQHFEENAFFQHQMLKERQYNDTLKFQLCKEHGIKILYYADYKYDFPYEVITNKELLLEIIRKNQ